MVLKDVKKGIVILSSIVVLSFSVTGCGGGGGGGSETPAASGIAESEKVTITEENSEQVISSTLGSIDSIDDPTNYLSTTTNTPLAYNALNKPAFKKVLDTTKNLKDLAAGSSQDCPNGGSLSVSSNSQTSGTGTYNQCDFGNGLVIDGTVSFDVSSDSLSGTYTYTDFTMSVDGEVVISYDSLKYTYQYSSSYELISSSITLSGKISTDNDSTEFLNYSTTFKLNADNKDVVSVNGFVKTACIGGWVEVTTTRDIILGENDPYGNDCPEAGEIIIDGNGSEVRITFNNDGSVDLSGAVNVHHNSCYDIESSVCTQ